MAIVPVNPFQALAAGDTLSVIVFAMALGIGVLLAGEAARPLDRHSPTPRGRRSSRR